MITLKKAFETQNVLKTLLNSAESYLKSEANVTQTIETHLKSKANANAQDETIVVPRNSDIECSVEHVVDFCLHIAAEMETLTNAINAAKAKENYDGLVSARMQQAFTNAEMAQARTNIDALGTVTQEEFNVIFND